jgi:hypothetical protein
MPDSRTRTGTYPTYVGLGVAKAGTTLLHRWLEEHPEVCVPRALKEVNFFTTYYDRGLGWYRSQFDPQPGESAIGEFSVTYLDSDLAQARIAHDLPEARCLVTLRDPVARLDSEYRDSIRLAGQRWDRRRFMSVRAGAVERGRYGRHLKRLYERFPRERVRVFIFEELIASPANAARELFEFLEVDAAYVPPSLHDRVNPSRGSRLPWIDQLAHKTNLAVRERNIAWLGRIGRSGAVRRIRALNQSTKADFPPPMDATLTRELRDAYSEEVVVASKLLGRDLYELWPAGGKPAPENEAGGPRTVAGDAGP